MSFTLVLTIVLILSLVGYWLGKGRAAFVAGRDKEQRLHSRPAYYGLLTALWCGIPALLLLIAWGLGEPLVIENLVVAELPAEMRALPENRVELLVNEIRNMVDSNMVAGDRDEALSRAADRYRQLRTTSGRLGAGLVLLLANFSIFMVWRRIRPAMKARNHVERIVKAGLIVCASFAVFITLGIVLSVLFESIRFFKIVPIHEFLFGLKWSPQMSIRADQVGSSGAFGAIPVFAGTLMISLIAMLVAVPLGLMSAIYLSEYANRKFRAVAKPLLEILAGIPTVVYGFFAALTVAPFLRESISGFGFDVSSESALAAGLVMGIMIIPFVSSLSDDVINAVPQAMRDGAYALGATRSETIKQVVIPAALPGIVGGILLAVSRAIGETMIVVMAAGLAANLTANPFQAVTTVTVQIVTLLVGDQEFDSPKTLAAFALGLVLFVVTLILNIVALFVVRKYREQYE
ncbi:MAG: phosphate ABC transporter permease subunit PstC [Desulfurivibrionaceae bacterium]|nr:phosphate ABC transporter permease subunit PstC [Desulfobulbales bacterium]MDT8335322.1 phosphate ABC transporter permease subunit PstC [Desulfurivibrionaceae bacterium]